MAFRDEFDGTTWNPAVWAPNQIFGTVWRTSADTGQVGWSPHDGRGMSVSNSILSLIARHEDPRVADPLCPSTLPGTGDTPAYTIGFLSSHPSFAFTVGYFETSMRVAVPDVTGSWPAIWSKTRYGTDRPENDLAEWNTADSNQLDVNYIDTGSTFHVHQASITSGFHTYGCRITLTDLTYFWDGSQVFTTANDGTTPPWVIMLDHWVTTSATGTGYPTQADFDYVRVWTPNGVPAQPAITSISPSTGIPTGGTVAVSFGAVSGATSYRAVACPVDQGGGPGIPGIPSPLTATGAGSPITVSGLTNGTAYNFTVSALNGTGYSVESAVVPSF